MAQHRSNDRDIALANGKKTYLSGKPCPRGHLTERLVSNYVCIQCCDEVHYPKDRDRYRTGNTLKKQFSSRKQSAIRNGIPFTIKFEDIEQPEYCPILGLKLNYEWSGKGIRDNSKATLDKVVPELGYIPGNVYVISWRANKLKCDMTLVELKKIMNYIKEKTNG
jgi:hypothetical protein